MDNSEEQEIKILGSGGLIFSASRGGTVCGCYIKPSSYSAEKLIEELRDLADWVERMHQQGCYISYETMP